MDLIESSDPESVEALGDRIATLVLQRQSLRASSADTSTLESNRLELVRLQQLLAQALGRQYGANAA